MGNSEHTEHTEHHIMPFATYMKVAAALFALTFLTVGFHLIHDLTRPFSALIAFTIAAVKANLVMAWFMHLKYESTLNRIVFGTGFLFLGVLIFFCVLDIYTRLTISSVL